MSYCKLRKNNNKRFGSSLEILIAERSLMVLLLKFMANFNRHVLAVYTSLELLVWYFVLCLNFVRLRHLRQHRTGGAARHCDWLCSIKWCQWRSVVSQSMNKQYIYMYTPDYYLPLSAALFCHLTLIRWEDVLPACSFCVNQGGSFIKHQQGLRFSSVVEIWWIQWAVQFFFDLCKSQGRYCTIYHPNSW